MKSAIEIGIGKPIESNQIQNNKDFLSVNSRQQFMGINFVKDFQQDPNSAIDHTDRSDFSFLHKHCVTDPRHCSDSEFKEFKENKESKLLHDQVSDDYFPQGEEYEDEIGTDEHQKCKRTLSKKPLRFENEYNNLEPTVLVFENNKCINRGPLTRFVTRVHFSSIDELADRMLMSKKVSNKDAIEKLRTLIEKVTEFKRRVFQSKHDAPKTEATTERKKKRTIANENEKDISVRFINQRISMSEIY